MPKLNIKPIKTIFSFVIRHKILIIICVLLIVFAFAAMQYRADYIAKMNLASKNSSNDDSNFAVPTNQPVPTINLPSPTENPADVLGTSTYSNSFNYAVPTPFPTFAPLPTIAPLSTTTTTTTSSSSTSNSSGNSNCTTGSGVPNAWYSDVYPNPPATTNNGSMTLLVYIRDCNKNTAPVSDNITITLTSVDSTAKINGSSSPVTIQTQNGYASFTVSSQNAITDTFSVQDATHSFTVTDVKNYNPSVTFTTSSGGSNGNSNCTTANGTPNSWYSDVYPTSPVTGNTGSSVAFTVDIRDCGQNKVSSDNITVTQTSSDSSLTINGSAPPASFNVQNGEATFTVSSQNAGTDTFTVQDATSNFAVTDTNNHSPSVVFSGSSSAPTPTPTTATTPTPTSADTPAPSSTPSP